MKRTFSSREANRIGATIGVNFAVIDAEQFRQGLSIELEHGTEHTETNVTNDNFYITGKIAWVHLKEIPDYYDRLTKLEAMAEKQTLKPVT